MFGALRAGFEGSVVSIWVFSGLLTTARGISGLEVRIQDFQSIQVCDQNTTDPHDKPSFKVKGLGEPYIHWRFLRFCCRYEEGCGLLRRG